MAGPSPNVTVQDGGGTIYTVANGAATVTAGNVITIALISASGVANWTATIVGQDEVVAAPTITVNLVAKTATFTAPAGPWSLIIASVVNSGVDISGQQQASYTQLFKVCVLTATTNLPLMATNETSQQSPTAGWVPVINKIARAVTTGGGGSVPTGTGFTHITSGSQDGAARAVDVSSADITGVMATANQASQAMGGDCSGTTAAATVTKITGAAGVLALASTASTVQWATGQTAVLEINTTAFAQFSAAATDFVKLGATAAASGLVRTSNAVTIVGARNAANSADIVAFSTDASNNIIVGGSNGNGVKCVAGSTTVCQLAAASTDFFALGGSTVAAAGAFRFANAVSPILAARNSGNTADLVYLDTNTTDLFVGGSAASTKRVTNLNLNALTTVLIAANGANIAQLTSNAADFLVLGGAPASAGFVRVSNNTTALAARNAANAANITLVGTDASNNILIGNGNNANITLTGNLVGGYFTQAMADAPQTISAANSLNNAIVTTGANTAVRALTITSLPSAGTMKFIRNNCTSNGITVQFSSGSATGTIAPGASALVVGDGTNAVVLMTGT